MEQVIVSGNDFDGTVPVGQLSRQDGIEVYPPGTSGGVFDFGLTAPVSVRAVELQLGGQSAWTVHKRDVQGRELLVMCGTTEASFISTEGDSFVLTDNQSLVIRTTGASSEMLARVSVQAFR